MKSFKHDTAKNGKAKQSFDGLLDSGSWQFWTNGVFDALKEMNENLCDAEDDIRRYDSDGAISYSHSSNQSKRDSVGADIGVLSKFMDKVDGVVSEKVDEPFYKDLDAFVDGMQDLSITTYTTTNRIGATTTTTVFENSYTQKQVEVPKKDANIEDLLSGDNFYGNQLTDMYDKWKLANPDEKDVSKSDFIVGSVHTRAFEYKSIKDEQQEKEFWVNIVSAVVIIGVGIFCPPAGLALGLVMGGLEMSSAISGKDWVSGRELDSGERVLRGGLSLLDIVPGVKALSSGAKAVTTGTRLAGLADNVLTSSAKNAATKIDDVIRLGKSEIASRLGNLKTAANDAIQAAGTRLTRALDEASETVARFSDNISNALPQRQLAAEGVGALPAGSKAATNLSKASDEVRSVLSRIDTSLGGGGRSASGKIDEVVKESDKVKNFQSRIDDIRGKMPNSKLKNQGNMAIADVNIKNLPDEFMAHSKIHGPDSKGAELGKFSSSSENKFFESYTVDKFPRYNDTEVKILEDIASKIKDPSISGKIDLYTELPACQSCSNVILEFRRKFPNIELNIFTK